MSEEFSTIELNSSSSSNGNDRPATRFQVDPVEYRRKPPPDLDADADAEANEDDTFPENENITSTRRSSR